MLDKIKSHTFEAVGETLKNVVKSAVTGFILAIIAGATTIFGSFVPGEFRQHDVLFIIVVLGFFFGVALWLLIGGKKWSLRLISIVILICVGFSTRTFYTASILHGLPDIQSNIVVIVLPEDIAGLEVQSYANNLQLRLPRAIKGSAINADIYVIHTYLAGKLWLDDKTRNRSLLSSYLSNNPKVIGVVELIEDKQSFVLKTSVPAIEKYFDLGLSWVDVTTEGKYPHTVSGVAGVDHFNFEVSVGAAPHAIHGGVSHISLGLGASVSSNGVDQDDLQRYRLLPIESTIRIPFQHLLSGVFFTANMAVAAYSRLQGDTQALCRHVQEYVAYEKENPDLDYLPYINFDNSLPCLLEQGESVLQRAVANKDKKAMEDIQQNLLATAMRSDQYDMVLERLDFIDSQQFSTVKKAREQCQLTQETAYLGDVESCLLGQLHNVELDSHSAGKKIIANTLYDEYLNFLLLQKSVSPELRNTIFQLSMNIDSYLDQSACERFETLIMLSFLQIFDSANEEWIAIAFDRFMGEASPLYIQAGCQQSLRSNFNFHELMTNVDLQETISTGLHTIFDQQGFAHKTIAEIMGEVLRLFKTVEDRLWVESPKNTLSLSRTYDAVEVEKYSKELLSQAVEYSNIDKIFFPGFYDNLPFFRDSASNEIIEVFSNIDLHKTVSEFYQDVDKTLNVQESGGFTKARNLAKHVHQRLSQHFLDPYVAEVTGLLVYGFDEAVFEQYVRMQSHQPNALHRLYFYRVLNDYLGQQKRLKPVLDDLERFYPEETGSARFLHYEMLSNIQAGKDAIAMDIARIIVPRVDNAKGLYYTFVALVLNQGYSSVMDCSSLLQMTEFSKWTDYLLKNSGKALLFHLSSKAFIESEWPYNNVAGSLNHETDLKKQQYQFSRLLQGYLSNYDRSDFEDKQTDPLYQLIVQAKQACS